MDKPAQGILFGLVAAFCRGIIPVLIRAGVSPTLMHRSVSPVAGLTLALVDGIILYFPVLWWRGLSQEGFGRHILRYDRKGIIFYTLAGISNAFAVLFWYLSLSYAEAVVVAPIQTMDRIFTLILAYLFIQQVEKIGWRVILGTLITVGGTYLIVTA